MIFVFKDGLLYIRIVYKLKQISFETNLLVIVPKKRFLTAQHFLQQYRVPRLQCQVSLIAQYLTCD